MCVMSICLLLWNETSLRFFSHFFRTMNVSLSIKEVSFFLFMWIYSEEMQKSTIMLSNKKFLAFQSFFLFFECYFKGHYSLKFSTLLTLKSIVKLLVLKYVYIKLEEILNLKIGPISLRVYKSFLFTYGNKIEAHI